MKQACTLIACVLVLAACGVDGDPIQPTPDDGTQSVPVTGTATDGMTVGTTGKRGYGGVRVKTEQVSPIVGY